MANRVAYLACVIAAIVTLAVCAEEAATEWSWEYDAACDQEPHAASSVPFGRSSTGSASFSEAAPPLLQTFDHEPTRDGRFYYLPRHAYLEQRGKLRIEFAVRIVRSEGSPAATCVQVPLLAEPVGPMKLGPLRLGPHGEGHQEFVGRDLRYIMVSFQTNGADPADDELVLLDIANPAEVRELVRHRIPLDVLQTYSIEVVRTGADRAADELRLAVGDGRTEPMAVRLDQLNVVASRDGIQWQRVARGKPFLPLGPKGTFDTRQIRPASSLVVLADRILPLYSGSPHPHVSAHQYDIGLATLRLDGFAAMEAGNDEGTIVTQPLQFQAGRLSINATTQSGGYVKAELLAAVGRPLDAYTTADCTVFEGDSTRHIVTWNRSGNMPDTPIEGLRLRFTLRHAKLYAFAAAHP